MAFQVRLLSAAGSIIASVALATGCGTSTSPTAATDEPSTTSSASITSAPVEPSSTAPTPLEFPPDFIKTMEQNGYVLESADENGPSVTADQAIANARDFYGLYTAEDPVVADYFLVTTPNSGPLKDPNDPESGIIKPTLDRTLMWVIYARAEMPKDERYPDKETVTGTVVAFVYGETGVPESAITF